ncbi:AraC family transcriptional regulator N-terminal domain-containing protein [Maridesulfovibrio sp.]|uniref:AraC family transcriptional regulator n=1 Tax=unclassified Maridesulfovibrio TaxID=2794999 RepID=UPI003AFFEE5F
MSLNQETQTKALQEARQDLATKVLKWTTTDHEVKISVPGMEFHKYTMPTMPVSVVHKPSVCLVVQGSKQVQLNENIYLYDANRYLFTSVNFPIIANIVDASPEVPFLGITWELDLQVVTRLIADRDLPATSSTRTERGVALGEVTPELLNTYIRLLDLLDTPDDIPYLAPLIHKELVYRLLTGDQGDRLRQVVNANSNSRQISQAVDWIIANFDKPVRGEELAARAGMSKSAFHEHFRSVTAMTPLQFQKWMRLQEARKLMISEKMDVTSAATKVGYESPSQFSREYSRQFGASPKQDIKKLQETIH